MEVSPVIVGPLEETINYLDKLFCSNCNQGKVERIRIVDEFLNSFD